MAEECGSVIWIRDAVGLRGLIRFAKWSFGREAGRTASGGVSRPRSAAIRSQGREDPIRRSAELFETDRSAAVRTRAGASGRPVADDRRRRTGRRVRGADRRTGLFQSHRPRGATSCGRARAKARSSRTRSSIRTTATRRRRRSPRGTATGRSVQSASGVTVTKGVQDAAPTKPSKPAGEISLRYARVDYQAGGTRD